ncbi:Self-incomp_S1 domain-containing protein, partial [Cephalotus follicularis]
NVTIHCKSKNDDLGIHVISSGQSYGWGFKINFWQTTLFFCGFTTEKGRGVYDIYKASRDNLRCLNDYGSGNTCFWDVEDDGVHGYAAIAQIALTKVHVGITNKMDSNVTIHCKSKDDDLGIHVLSSGQSYGWGFRVNLWETTLFFCGFTTKKGGGVYNIYQARRDKTRCHGSTCLWDVKDDG